MEMFEAEILYRCKEKPCCSHEEGLKTKKDYDRGMDTERKNSQTKKKYCAPHNMVHDHDQLLLSLYKDSGNIATQSFIDRSDLSK